MGVPVEGDAVTLGGLDHRDALGVHGEDEIGGEIHRQRLQGTWQKVERVKKQTSFSCKIQSKTTFNVLCNI